MTVKQIKARLEELGVEYDPRLLKPDLEALLKKAEAEVSTAEPDPSIEETGFDEEEELNLIDEEMEELEEGESEYNYLRGKEFEGAKIVKVEDVIINRVDYIRVKTLKGTETLVRVADIEEIFGE